MTVYWEVALHVFKWASGFVYSRLGRYFSVEFESDAAKMFLLYMNDLDDKHGILTWFVRAF